tara:strand:+ start:250 stop:630 length:381 start_codon:yes stop_codon:yes gene_type:complete
MALHCVKSAKKYGVNPNHECEWRARIWIHVHAMYTTPKTMMKRLCHHTKTRRESAIWRETRGGIGMGRRQHVDISVRKSVHAARCELAPLLSLTSTQSSGTKLSKCCIQFEKSTRAEAMYSFSAKG